MRTVVVALVSLVLLVGCGGPSPEQLQATVAASVAATAQAQEVATSVAATQIAAEPCSQAKLNAYVDAVAPLIEKFDRQTSVTANTPRMSLGVPLQELLNIQNDVIALKPPECATDYHDRVVGMMGLYRFAYESFAAQGNENAIQLALTMAANDMAIVRGGLNTLRDGNVPPTRTPVP